MPNQTLLLVANLLDDWASPPREPRPRETRSCGSRPLIWPLRFIRFVWFFG